MFVAKVLKGLALAAVMVSLAMVCGVFLSEWLGVNEGIIWFIFGGAYNDLCRKWGI